MAYDPIKSGPADKEIRPQAIIKRPNGLTTSVSEQRSKRAVQNGPSDDYPSDDVLVIRECWEPHCRKLPRRIAVCLRTSASGGLERQKTISAAEIAAR